MESDRRAPRPVRLARGLIALGLLAAVLTGAAVGGLARANPAAASTPRVSVDSDIQYGDDGGPLLLDVYQPADSDTPHPAVLMIHGGDWTGGNKSSLASESRVLAQQGFVAFNLNYRLAGTDGEPGYPSQVNDVTAAYRWVLKNGSRYHADTDHVGVVGASAGGHLAAMLATTVNAQSQLAPIDAVVSLSGPMDLSHLVHRIVKLFPCAAGPVTKCAIAPRLGDGLRKLLGCDLGSCPNSLLARASPVSHVSADSPPFFIANGTTELVPAEQAKLMAKQLRKHHVPTRLDLVPGSAHATEYIAQVAEPAVKFLQRHLGGTAKPAPSATPTQASPPSSGGRVHIGLWVLVGLALAGTAVYIVRRWQLSRR
jgi:acetyl esterase/lipase